MKSLREVQEYYDGLREQDRRLLQSMYGRQDETNREEKFYKWLAALLDILDLMVEHQMNLTDVIDMVILNNGVIGVGLVSLGDNIREHVRSRI